MNDDVKYEAYDVAVSELQRALTTAAAAHVAVANAAAQLADGSSVGRPRRATEVAMARFREALLDLGEAALDAHLVGALLSDADDLAEPESASIGADDRCVEDEAPAAANEPASTRPKASPTLDQSVILAAPAPLASGSLDSATLAALERKMNGGAFVEERATESAFERLRSAWRSARLVASITTYATYQDELDRLRAMIEPSARADWRHLHPGVHHALVEHLAARIRRLQAEADEAHRSPGARDEDVFGALIRALADQSKEARVGYAYGLALGHAPQHGTWLEDARAAGLHVDAALGAAEPDAEPDPFNPERALDALTQALEDGLDGPSLQALVRSQIADGMSIRDPRLLDLLVEHVDRLKGSEFSSLRGKIRRFDRAQGAEAEAEAEADETDEWVEAATLAGKRLVLVGGDRQARPCERLQARLPNTTVDWIETSRSSGVRQVQALVGSINRGCVDVVLIVQRFLSHKVSDAVMDAAKASPCAVQFGLVHRGYGLSQIHRALARAIADQPQPDSEPPIL